MNRRRLGLVALVALVAAAALCLGGRSRPVAAEAVPEAIVRRERPSRPLVSAEPVPETPPAEPPAEEPARVEVRCPLAMADPVEGPVEMSIDLVAEEPGSTRGVSFTADLRAGDLVFRDHPESLGRGEVTVPGYLEAALEWAPGPDGSLACPEVRLRQGAVIVGTVDPPPRHEEGGEVYVSGCGGFERVADDGTFYLEGTPEPCEVRARREDGWYSVQSEPVRVLPRLGEEVEVRLELPEALQSGLGARTEAVDEGLRLVAVRKGSAAAAAGLRPGDVVLAVDGTEVAGLDGTEFGALTKGDVGGTLVIEALVDGVRTRHVTTRTFVPSEHVRVDVPMGYEMRPDPEVWVR